VVGAAVARPVDAAAAVAEAFRNLLRLVGILFFLYIINIGLLWCASTTVT
jgi:hypothetical protein